MAATFGLIWAVVLITWVPIWIDGPLLVICAAILLLGLLTNWK